MAAQATAASIIAVARTRCRRDYPAGDADLGLAIREHGWVTAASLFAWIKCRSEQATAEGWHTELALRLTSLEPSTLGRRRGEIHSVGSR